MLRSIFARARAKFAALGAIGLGLAFSTQAQSFIFDNTPDTFNADQWKVIPARSPGSVAGTTPIFELPSATPALYVTMPLQGPGSANPTIQLRNADTGALVAFRTGFEVVGTVITGYSFGWDSVNPGNYVLEFVGTGSPSTAKYYEVSPGDSIFDPAVMVSTEPITFDPVAVPEPATYSAVFGILLVAGAARRRWLRNGTASVA